MFTKYNYIFLFPILFFIIWRHL